jgi:hypothetical protein
VGDGADDPIKRSTVECRSAAVPGCSDDYVPDRTVRVKSADG